MEHPHGREMGHLGRPDMEPFSIRKLDSSCQGMVFPATICSVVNCFVFVTQGEILVGSNNSSLLVGVGELLLIPQGVPFTIKHYKECVGYMGGFHSSFIGSGVFTQAELRQVKVLQERSMSKFSFPASQSEFVASLFARMGTEFRKAQSNKDLIKCLMMSVLAEANALSNGAENLFLENCCDRFLRELFDDSQPIRTIPDYADALKVSPNHLNKLVKKNTGKTVSQWIDDSLIIRAKALLCETDLPVAEVAERLNVLDVSYFIRKFKKHTGQTPLDFRKRYGGRNG
ncbi:MAG: helix-turn-helix transcriptional regulator [Paludibacteraceae bacterium]|nr:helix-turn-helix transcriptional regulator [Paludibacteraceae bacterium]